jgi:hypothetical protein
VIWDPLSTIDHHAHTLLSNTQSLSNTPKTKLLNKPPQKPNPKISEIEETPKKHHINNKQTKE